ncbi:hypothetical protein [Botrimarina hoheduenensis]|uniref:Phage metallopeptidase domain-containing protein n=1 Tax=Botrimarina hoheduenensis TaxID=2528000 RepID=A0A5C5W7K2_9BACT|nr:hypothetical protein [Botrimarina hoheduenensis]TWT46574.1 hypothetical protein Pla111_16700 [Botrimarina hoheduenensis]
MPLDFSAMMRAVCVDLTRRLPELAHVQMDRIGVGYRQARARVPHGLQASLTPLRFRDGAITERRGRRVYGCPRVLGDDGRELLYLLNFYLPRFLDHALEEKLTTIVHELWHVSPAMDGDLRRHDGRCYAHGHSQQDYDAHAAGLAKRWLSADPPTGVYAFLEVNFEELVQEHGGVSGRRFRVPRLAPLAAA